MNEMVVVGTSSLDDLDIAAGRCLTCSGEGKLALTDEAARGIADQLIDCRSCSGTGSVKVSSMQSLLRKIRRTLAFADEGWETLVSEIDEVLG